jgi:hypothetical protein
MSAFTSFTPDPNAITPPGCGPSSPNMVLNHSNGNIEPGNNNNNACRTPLSSSVKHSRPGTPQPSDKPTPLRRRYLEEVAMSPATPPRTPSPIKGRTTPSKRANSPTKDRDSPTKQMLEIGQNGFYFSCELPMSKVTPKKADSGTMTPMRRTPSPTKTGSARKETTSRGASPVKQTPSKRKSPDKQTLSKVLRGLPVKGRIPGEALKEAPAVPAPSATKNGLPKMSAIANSLSRTPIQSATTINPPKEANSVKEVPLGALDRAFMLMQGAAMPPATAPAGAKVVTNGETIIDDNVVPAAPQPTKSPRPSLNATGQTPTKAARGASFDIGDLMAGLKSNGSRPRAATTDRMGDTSVTESPTPLAKAAQRLTLSDVERIWNVQLNSPAKNASAVPLSPVVDASPVSRIPIPFKIKEKTQQCPPVLFPSLKAESISSPEDTPSTWKKIVKFEDPDTSSPKPPKLQYQKTPRRAGTDPEVLSSMQREMYTLQTSLSNSLGVDFKFSGRENTFELPAMANSLLESDHQARPKLGHLRTGSKLSAVSNSTTSSMSTVRASMLMNPKESASPKKVELPKFSRVAKAPEKVRSERLGAAKEKDTQLSTPKKLTAPSAFNRSFRATTVTTPSTPRNKSAMTRTKSTPCLQTLKPTTKSAITPSKPTSTSYKPKPSIPASARKSTLVSTPGKPISTPKPRPSTLRPNGTTRTTPRFASATDIADRIAKWNSQDRVRTTTKPVSSAQNTPSKPPVKSTKSPKAEKEEESYTPPGSPSNPPTLTKPLIPRRVAPKAPATPKPANPALARLKGTGLPRTPIARREVRDPGATRTPSKEIEGSLGSAIDRKIAEDRMRVGM